MLARLWRRCSSVEAQRVGAAARQGQQGCASQPVRGCACAAQQQLARTAAHAAALEHLYPAPAVRDPGTPASTPRARNSENGHEPSRWVIQSALHCGSVCLTRLRERLAQQKSRVPVLTIAAISTTCMLHRGDTGAAHCARHLLRGDSIGRALTPSGAVPGHPLDRQGAPRRPPAPFASFAFRTREPWSR